MNYTGLLAGKIVFKKAKQSRSKEFLLYQVCVFTVNVFHNPVYGIFSENGLYYMQYMIFYYNGYIMKGKLFFAGPGEWEVPFPSNVPSSPSISREKELPPASASGR